VVFVGAGSLEHVEICGRVEGLANRPAIENCGGHLQPVLVLVFKLELNPIPNCFVAAEAAESPTAR